MNNIGLLTIFMLSVFVGFEVISKVSTILHTPLMSGANAIHGVILVGAILITGSLGGETGMMGNIGYCTSKHAAVGIARTVAMEAAASGVRCNWISPGFIDTAMLADVPESFKAQMASRVPQKRIGTPAEAGSVAAFLLSEGASHVTAQGLAIDGGLLGTLVIEA